MGADVLQRRSDLFILFGLVISTRSSISAAKARYTSRRRLIAKCYNTILVYSNTLVFRHLSCTGPSGIPTSTDFQSSLFASNRTPPPRRADDELQLQRIRRVTGCSLCSLEERQRAVAAAIACVQNVEPKFS